MQSTLASLDFNAAEPDLIVKRFEFLHESRDKAFAALISRDVSTVSPAAEMRLHSIDFG